VGLGTERGVGRVGSGWGADHEEGGAFAEVDVEEKVHDLPRPRGVRVERGRGEREEGRERGRAEIGEPG
jgi:hypothetical protein